MKNNKMYYVWLYSDRTEKVNYKRLYHVSGSKLFNLLKGYIWTLTRYKSNSYRDNLGEGEILQLKRTYNCDERLIEYNSVCIALESEINTSKFLDIIEWR